MDSSRLVSAIYIHCSARFAIRYDSNRSSRIKKIEQNDRERRSGNDIHRFKYINAMSEGVTRCSKRFSRCRTIETEKIIYLHAIKRIRINIFFFILSIDVCNTKIFKIKDWSEQKRRVNNFSIKLKFITWPFVYDKFNRTLLVYV